MPAPSRRAPAPTALLLTALLAACSSGSVTTKATPTPTPSATAAATPTTTPSAGPTSTGLSRGVLSAWKGCGDGFECATLTVPLDDAKPSLGTVGLAMTRKKAIGKDRVGTLFVNPGGPGASAVDYVKAVWTGIPKTVREHFDIAAFDPRGVGQTAPVHCLSTAQLDSYFHVDPVPDDAQELKELDDANRELAAGCQAKSGRILPYVNTEVVAQDLERARIAVGDSKLSYLGYSYGTAIGASYLDQFPTHVRAMVLDGALDPSLTWDQLLAGQSMGFDVALGAFLADCEKKRCEFRTKVKGDLTQAYDDLAKRVETKPLPGSGSRVVGPGEFSYGVGQALYSTSLWPYLAQALSEAESGSGRTLLALNDEYLERSDSGYANLIEANFAVNCVDRPWPRTDKPYQDLAVEVGKKYPRFGPSIALSGLGCAVWPTPVTGSPHRVTAPGSPPVVVLGNTRDPATPYVWARALASQLSEGVLLTHDGDGHTVYRNSAPACIKDPVSTYLVTLKVPTPVTC